MSNKHRHLAAIVTLVGLISIPLMPAHAGDGLNAFGLLTRDTALVVAADVSRLSKSQAAVSIFSALAQDSEFAEMKAKLSKGADVDLSRDVDTLVLAMAGDIEKKERIVMIAEGRFNAAKVTAFLKKDAKSFAAKKHAKTPYYLIDDDNELAFLGTFMVMTPKGGMSRVIDTHQGNVESLRKNAVFMSLVKRPQHKKSLWFALNLPANMRKEIASDTGGHSVDSAILGIDMANDVALSMNLVTSNKKAASAIATVFRDASAEMAKDPSLATIGLADSFKGMSVREHDTAIDVSISIPAASVQQLATMFKTVM